MTRRDPTSSAGCVRWPTYDDPVWKDSGEGGMWAAAVVLAQAYPDEPFDACHGPSGTIALPLQDLVVHDPGEVYADGTSEWTALMNQPRSDRRQRDLDAVAARCGEPVLACVVLGASGGSWHGGELGDYFRVTRDHLDIQGVEIVDGLEALFGRPVHIVTYLDT